MPKLPSLVDMLKAGAHFGHQKSRWHPKMEQYIFGVRNGVHVIDLEKTLVELDKTLNYAKTLAAKGKVILFVGTKRQARASVQAAAQSCGMPFLTERWIGGLLTNFDEVKRRIKKYLNLKQQFATGEIERYTKKEQITLKKQLEKMDRYLIGLQAMDRLPDALYIADMRVEKTALAEALRTGVPVVGVCDTNVNPEKAVYVIPANDDAVNSIKMMADLMAAAVNEGKVDYEKNKVIIAKEEAAKKAAAPVAKLEMKKPEGEKKPRRALKKEESI